MECAEECPWDHRRGIVRAPSPAIAALQKRQLARGEIREVWKYLGEGVISDAEPRRQGRSVLVERNGWKPHTTPGDVLRALQRQCRETAIHIRRLDRGAHHHVVASPCMIGSLSATWLQCSSKLRLRKSHHLLFHAHLACCVIERRHRRRYFSKQHILPRHRVTVRVEIPERHIKDLAIHPQVFSYVNDLRDFLQLLSQPRRGKGGRQRRSHRKCGVQLPRCVQAIGRHPVHFLDQSHTRVEFQDLLESRVPSIFR